jgi:hypothetical protein
MNVCSDSDLAAGLYHGPDAVLHGPDSFLSAAHAVRRLSADPAPAMPDGAGDLPTHAVPALRHPAVARMRAADASASMRAGDFTGTMSDPVGSDRLPVVWAVPVDRRLPVARRLSDRSRRPDRSTGCGGSVAGGSSGSASGRRFD